LEEMLEEVEAMQKEITHYREQLKGRARVAFDSKLTPLIVCSSTKGMSCALGFS
jgi:hypothetical protein